MPVPGRSVTRATEAMRTESEIIERISRGLANRRPSSYKADALLLGIGDDAAVLRGRRRGHDLALSCDAFLQDVHFLADMDPPDAVGYKALARATSDLAAVGATPRFFMLTLALPPGRTGAWLDGVIKGMARAAREFGMVLIGGDTSRNATILMSITVGGDLPSGRAITRSGAHPGDGIYVSGTLGGAQLGLELVLRGVHRDRRWKQLLNQHLRPKIQIELGKWLTGALNGHRVASAATDTSDGLSTDLTHICQASGVRARIFATQIPSVKLPASLACHRFDPLELALHGGEDYQLLFTVSPAQENQIPKVFHGTQITKIGEILSTKSARRSGSVELVGADGKKIPLVPRGWDSFRVSSRKSKR
jgi:thiamine-monophosphate kinase